MLEGDPAALEPVVRKPAGLLANSAWMFLSQGLGILISGGISIYAIRTLAPATWGQYSTAFALIAVFTVFSGLGLSQLTLRSMSAAPAEGGAVLNQAVTTLAVTTAVAGIALVVTVLALGYPNRVLLILALIGPLLFVDPFLGLLQSAFNAQRVLVYASSFQIARSVVYGAIAAILLAFGHGVIGLAIASLASALAAAAFALILLRRELGLTLSLSFAGTRSFIRAGAAFGGIGVVGVLYDRIDIIMLSVLGGARDVAHYTVPYTWVRLSWLVPSVIAGAFFPVLAQALDSDRGRARRLFLAVVRVFFCLSLPLSLALAVGSPTIVEGVFGHQYHSSVTVLEIMSWTSVLGFQNYVLWYGVVAAHREKVVLGIQAIGLLLNVAINAIAIPRYGATGAAVALLASDLVVVVGQAIVIDRTLFPLPFSRLLTKPALATIVAVPVAVALARVTPLLGAAVGAIAYLALLAATQYVTPDEWRPVFLRIARRQAEPV